MAISARYNSLPRCCTWWLNSPRDPDMLSGQSVCMLLSVSNRDFMKLMPPLSLPLRLATAANKTQNAKASLNAVDTSQS